MQRITISPLTPQTLSGSVVTHWLLVSRQAAASASLDTKGGLLQRHYDIKLLSWCSLNYFSLMIQQVYLCLATSFDSFTRLWCSIWAQLHYTHHCSSCWLKYQSIQVNGETFIQQILAKAKLNLNFQSSLNLKTWIELNKKSVNCTCLVVTSSCIISQFVSFLSVSCWIGENWSRQGFLRSYFGKNYFNIIAEIIFLSNSSRAIIIFRVFNLQFLFFEKQ